MMERRAGIPRPCERNHLRGDIQPLDFVAMTLQQPKEPATATAPDIERPPAPRPKLQRLLMLPNPIRRQMRFQPLPRDGVVAPGDFGGLHG